MRREPDHTLQPTALIHEAYLRLIDQNQPFESRRQFYGVAAHLMRMILVDHARTRQTAKRGSGAQKLPLESAELFSEQRGIELLALDEVLDRLSDFDERKARAIELRYFAGMSVEETAELLDVSVATLRRELRFAENWLCRHLTKK
jgi:RNA polymerase sigma factor (TIGR02999 family)